MKHQSDGGVDHRLFHPAQTLKDTCRQGGKAEKHDEQGTGLHDTGSQLCGIAEDQLHDRG